MSPFRSVSIVVTMTFAAAAWSAPGPDAMASQGAQGAPGAQAPRPAGEVPIDASQVMLPCIPVGTYWNVEPPTEKLPEAPSLAVVSTDVRPKNARVHLDGEFIGRARFFNGKNGFLYLEPGSYRLELRHGGYRTLTIELDAAPRCRYELRHFLERDRGEGKQRDAFGRGEPSRRVFSPTEREGVSAARLGSEGRPDSSLRPDLARTEHGPAAQRPDASLRLAITPPEARLSVDGVFIATGRELSAMEGPLAVSSGSRLLEVTAPGWVPWSRDVEIERGQTIELEIALEPLDGT